jgi:hypothetical protein
MRSNILYVIEDVTQENRICCQFTAEGRDRVEAILFRLYLIFEEPNYSPHHSINYTYCISRSKIISR